MSNPIYGPSRIDTEAVRRKEQISQELQQSDIEQIPTEAEIDDMLDTIMASPTRQFKPLNEIKNPTRKEVEKQEKTSETSNAVQGIKEIEDLAEKFAKQNNEFQKKALLLLREQITEEDTAETILKKVLSFYPDKSLADEALDFIIATSKGKILEQAQIAKTRFNEEFSREIHAGKNISLQAKEFSEKGLGSPTALRDLYRDITGNPREPLVLFQHLSQRFSFSMMAPVLSFVLHALGADLKSKGPSIAPADLKNLMDDIRAIQAVVGVYRFFKSRINIIRKLFTDAGLPFPSQINFEVLAKQFMNLVQERYPTATRVLQMARLLGISEELAAQIIIFTQMLEAVRGVAPRIYKNNQQKQDLIEAYLEALEELEEKLEEQKDKEEKEKKKK
jgi:type III secretion protein W